MSRSTAPVMSGLKTRLTRNPATVAGFLFPMVLFRSVVMEFRNEERTHKLLCWWMDVSLLVIVGWIIGLIADMIRLS